MCAKPLLIKMTDYITMGISVHVYDSLDEYIKRTGHMVSDKIDVNETSLSLMDIWITNDEKLRVVLDCKRFFDRPDVSRSISCFQTNNIDKYNTGDEKLVEYDDVTFDPKTENLQFFKKRFRKAPIFFKVGRFWGDKPNKTTKIDWAYKFFNVKANRIDFVLLSNDTVVKKPISKPIP
tara:strand:- start:2640 stop:3173 length:534 start_codon:yes stop_codon:yes gene_type:complete